MTNKRKPPVPWIIAFIILFLGIASLLIFPMMYRPLSEGIYATSSYRPQNPFFQFMQNFFGLSFGAKMSDNDAGLDQNYLKTLAAANAADRHSAALAIRQSVSKNRVSFANGYVDEDASSALDPNSQSTENEYTKASQQGMGKNNSSGLGSGLDNSVEASSSDNTSDVTENSGSQSNSTNGIGSSANNSTSGANSAANGNTGSTTNLFGDSAGNSSSNGANTIPNTGGQYECIPGCYPGCLPGCDPLCAPPGCLLAGVNPTTLKTINAAPTNTQVISSVDLQNQQTATLIQELADQKAATDPVLEYFQAHKYDTIDPSQIPAPNTSPNPNLSDVIQKLKNHQISLH